MYDWDKTYDGTVVVRRDYQMDGKRAAALPRRM